MITGEQIGPFAIEKEVGSGAMGTVYRARYAKTGQIVAVKLVAPGLGQNERVMARFEREADMLKQLRHPNIVRLFGTGKYRGCPYFAMEFVDGESCEELLKRRGRLTWEEVIQTGTQVTSALRVAHAQGIIHRDLKPANLMITRDGTIKLTDFGIAKDMDATGLTSANCTVGTAAYMSPEQCRGEREITHKSDLYSLGIMLYELLTGHKPFVAENVMDMFMQHVQGEFVRPAQRVLDIPVWLDNLVCQLMEKKPEHRPADAEIVGQALLEVREKIEALRSAGVDVAGTVARKSKSSSEREIARTLAAASRKRRLKKKRTPWQVGAMAGLLILGLVGIGVLIFLALRPAGPEKLLKDAARLVQKGDDLLDDGDNFAPWEKWSQARDKHLNRVLDLDPDGPHGAKAKEHLRHIEAGNLYLKGRNLLQQYIANKNWKAINASTGLEHYHQVLDSFADDQLIAGRVRAELGPIEGPVLLEEIEKNADPWLPITLAKNTYERPAPWQQAVTTLERLRRWYPESAAGQKAADIQTWLAALEQGYQRLAESARTGTRPATLNQAENQGLETLQLELVARSPAIKEDVDRQQGLEQAARMWNALIAWGKEPGHDNKPRSTDPDYRPWLLLAEAKTKGSPSGKKAP